MNTLIKILLAVFGAVVLIFMAIAIAVAFIFEPNDYRPLLVDSVKEATGRDFALDGDLGLKLFPCCGVSVGSATLGNPPGFPPTPLASIDSASVSVKIWPLLTRREVQIGTVTLDGLDVNLVALPDGRTNWTFETDETEPGTGKTDDSIISSLTIEGLKISGGNITYSADGARYSARDIRVDAGAIGGDAPVPVAVQLTVRDENLETNAEVELVGTLGLSGDSLTLNEPRLALTATGTAIPTGEASADVTAATLRYDTVSGASDVQGLHASLALPGTRIDLRGDVRVADDAVTGGGEFNLTEGNLRRLLETLPEVTYTPTGSDALQQLTGNGRWALTKTSASVSELDLHLDGSRVRGSVDIASFATGAATVNLGIDHLNLDNYLPKAGPAAAGSTTQTPTEVPFESIADLLLDAEMKVTELTVSGTTLQGLDSKFRNDGRTLSVAVQAGLFGGRATLKGAGNPSGASPTLSGELAVDGVSPRATLTALGETVETANPDVLARLNGSTHWQLGRRSLTLEQMTWQLDNTRLNGSLGIENFDAPVTRFDLVLDRLNLDDYLAPDTDKAAADDGSDVEIPVELIRALDVQGQLKAAALRVMDLDLTTLAASVTARNGVLRLEPLSANLYGGAYRGSIVIDATGAKSRLSLDQQMSAVQVGQLLTALVGSDRIAGALTFNLTGTGEGNTQNELLKGLTGNVDFDLSDGVYHGMDIAYEIENAQSLLKRSAAPERPNRKETPIRALAFKGNLADGVLGSNDLKAEIPFLKLAGKGGVNLISRTLDYQLNAQVQKTADNALDARLKGLAGNTIPLLITGPMADPSVRVNLQGLVVDTVKDKARSALLKGLGISEDKPVSTGTASPAATSETGSAESAPAAAGPLDATADSTATSEPAPVEKAAEPPSTRELLERGLRGLLTKPAAEAKDSEN